MEDNFNKKPEQTVQKTSKQEPSAKMKKKKAKKAIITLSAIVVLFLGLQVYASVNGYGNVFFMIKNLITTGNPAGNQEIFSDKDITLSYKSIELAEGLKIQANRLEIKDGKTKLYLSVKSQNGELLPLKYEVETISNEGNETTTTTKITGTRPENTESFDYEDILTLDYEVEENKTIVLKIKDSSDKELRTLEINLQTREITVKGEKDFEKISQIELRKYLSLFSEMNNDLSTDDAVVRIALKLQNNYEKLINEEVYENAKNNLSSAEFTNAIIKEFYGENAKFEKINSQEKLEMKNATAYAFSERYGYTALTEGSEIKNGHCLKIEDVNYEDDVYTVKYIYLLATGYEEDDDKLEDLPQYETTIKLKRNENNKYSKYEIVSIEKGTEVKNKVSTDVNEEENNNQELDNNHDKHYYTVVEHSGSKGNDGSHTTLNGTHIEKCTVCNEERRVPHNFGKWFKLKNSSGEVYAYTLWCNDCKDYIYTTDYNVVKNSGYGINEEDQNNTQNNQKVDNYVHYFNWVNYRAPGLKFEYPTELKLENTGNQNDGELSTIITGTLVGRDVDTNQPIYSNIKIKVFNPSIVDEKIMNNLKYNPENGLERSNMTNNKGLRWYESVSQSDEAGYNEAETYSNFYQTADGGWGMRQIEFVTDNRNNFKITNLINRIIGSTESASY